MSFAVNVSDDDARSLTVRYLALHMIVQKQYLYADELEHIKYVLTRLSTLLELEEITRDFDRAWPNDITWN